MQIGITTFVHGWYQEYIPLFVYGINKAYPDYQAKVFVQGKLDAYIWETLQTLPKNYQIIENYMNDHKEEGAKKPYYCRWLIPYEDLAEFDCVFICDVDLIMLKENPPLHEQRLKICEKNQLPFANFIRTPHPNYPDRISGWHFIKTKEYFEATTCIIKSITNDPNFDISSPPSYCYNNGIGDKQWGQEALLFKIISSSFQCKHILEKNNLYPYHHGLHLGPFRGTLPDRVLKGELQAINHMGRNLSYWKHQDLTNICKDRLFLKLIKRNKGDKIKSVLDNFLRHFNNLKLL